VKADTDPEETREWLVKPSPAASFIGRKGRLLSSYFRQFLPASLIQLG